MASEINLFHPDSTLIASIAVTGFGGGAGGNMRGIEYLGQGQFVGVGPTQIVFFHLNNDLTAMHLTREIDGVLSQTSIPTPRFRAIAGDGRFLYTCIRGQSGGFPIAQVKGFAHFDLEGNLIRELTNVGGAPFSAIAYDGYYYYLADESLPNNNLTQYLLQATNIISVRQVSGGTTPQRSRAIAYDGMKFWQHQNDTGGPLGFIDRDLRIILDHSTTLSGVQDSCFAPMEDFIENISGHWQQGKNQRILITCRLT